MFSPNPEKAFEPIVLAPNQSFLLAFKGNPKGPAAPPAPGLSDRHIRKTVLMVKGVRWRATGEVMVAFNHDPHPGPASKYFAATEGEFTLNDKIETVTFWRDATAKPVRLYLEVE